MDKQEQAQPHKRRVRYKGTHPRAYKDKYKELQPDKYGDTVARVIQKGSTPAGMHISIMVHEILEFLQIQPGQIGLDATLGYGGHTKAMLGELKGDGHIYGLDVDPIERPKTTNRLAELGFGPDIFTSKALNFANVDELLAESGLVNFVLADLGVSSMQIDNPDRGFSYKTEGPLDLRLNPEKGISASERLNSISKDELYGMLLENADESHAKPIATAVVASIKKGHKIETTKDLRDVIEDALSFLPEDEKEEGVKKSCQRSFQALRIDVNNEYEVLYDFLDKLPGLLAPGARVAILSFHSGEDRLVKKSFKRLLRAGVYKEIATEIIRPSSKECHLNPRARSTKMRWAIKA